MLIKICVNDTVSAREDTCAHIHTRNNFVIDFGCNYSIATLELTQARSSEPGDIFSMFPLITTCLLDTLRTAILSLAWMFFFFFLKDVRAEDWWRWEEVFANNQEVCDGMTQTGSVWKKESGWRDYLADEREGQPLWHSLMPFPKQSAKCTKVCACACSQASNNLVGDDNIPLPASTSPSPSIPASQKNLHSFGEFLVVVPRLVVAR